MKYILPIVLLWVGSVAYSSAEELSVLLPLKSTVMDEYKQDVRVPTVKTIAMPGKTQMYGNVAMHLSSDDELNPSQIWGNKPLLQEKGLHTQGFVATWRMAIPNLSEETMAEIQRKPATVTTEVAAQKSVKRRLGESGGGMGSDSGDDPNRSELSPIGEGWSLLVFAFLYIGIRLRNSKREMITRKPCKDGK